MATQSITDPHITPQEEKREERGSFCGLFVKVLSQNTDLISALGILACNTVILASKIFKAVPNSVGYAAQSFLGVYSLLPINLNMQIEALVKAGQDIQNGYSINDHKGMLLSSLKVSFKAIDILLSIAFATAAIASFFGAPAVASLIFLVTQPLAVGSLAVSIFFDFYDYFESQKHLQLVNQMNEIELEGLKNQVQRVISHTFRRQDRLGTSVIRQLNPFTLKHIVGKNPSKEDIKKGVKRNYQWRKRDIKQSLLGYVDLFLYRLYPNTLLSAVLMWRSQLHYTIDLIEKKSENYLLPPLSNSNG